MPDDNPDVTTPPASPAAPAEGPTPASSQPTLARTMGLGALIIYGVGDMLGSGVYALVGKVAGIMGNAVWLAYLIAMIAAGLTALSYASLGSRYPRAGGAATFAHRAFAQPFLTYLIGLAVIASGLTSMAAQGHAFARYFYGLVYDVVPGTAPPDTFVWMVAIPFLLALTAVNFWGMRESTWLNLICTAIEVTGLAIVIAVGLRFWGSVNYLEFAPRPASDAGAAAATSGVGGMIAAIRLNGAVLAFFAFIGFEDMSNVCEEVKNPRRNFPIGVIAAVSVTSVIYMAIGITAVSVLPYEKLAASGQPLVDVVVTAAPWFPPVVFSFIALFAITNTALLNYIMGSRLIFALGRQGLLPRGLAKIHPTRRTPHRAIGALLAVVLVLLFAGGIADLGSATAALLLYAFVVVNAALLVLKRRPGEPPGGFEIPRIVPLLGAVVCAVLIVNTEAKAMKIAMLLLVGITILFLITRPQQVDEETLSRACGDEAG
jgi:amino acid transporter